MTMEIVAENEEDECRTPTALDAKIPAGFAPPPPPRKRKTANPQSNRLPAKESVVFFDSPEVEEFFRGSIGVERKQGVRS